MEWKVLGIIESPFLRKTKNDTKEKRREDAEKKSVILSTEYFEGDPEGYIAADKLDTNKICIETGKECLYHPCVTPQIVLENIMEGVTEQITVYFSKDDPMMGMVRIGVHNTIDFFYIELHRLYDKMEISFYMSEKSKTFKDENTHDKFCNLIFKRDTKMDIKFNSSIRYMEFTINDSEKMAFIQGGPPAICQNNPNENEYKWFLSCTNAFGSGINCSKNHIPKLLHAKGPIRYFEEIMNGPHYHEVSGGFVLDITKTLIQIPTYNPIIMDFSRVKQTGILSSHVHPKIKKLKTRWPSFKPHESRAFEPISSMELIADHECDLFSSRIYRNTTEQRINLKNHYPNRQLWHPQLCYILDR